MTEQVYFLTQDSGALVGSVGEGPVGGAVGASQFEVQMTSERLVVSSCKQPAALKDNEMRVKPSPPKEKEFRVG